MVREVGDFRILVGRMLKQLGSHTAAALNEGQLDFISALIYQLFLNADEHGSFDPSGSRYEHAMRGIAIRTTAVADISALVRLAGDDTALRAYLVRLSLPRSERALSTPQPEKPPIAPIQLLEISVFDTGPGLGLRWLADTAGRTAYSEFSVEEEFEAVQACFAMHSTTKASQFFGQGLSMALHAMKRLSAFMTLRTGRLSLYQDLSRSDTVEFKPKNRFAKGETLPAIAGTGYTISFRVK
jgi:hypothetical protein